MFGTQDNKSIICGFYCITFIEYMLTGKALIDYTNLFSPNDYKKNDKILYKVFLKMDILEEACLEFRLRTTDETRNYLLDEILQKLNTIEVLISKALIDSCISSDEFLLVNNVLREYCEMKEEVKNSETSVQYTM